MYKPVQIFDCLILSSILKEYLAKTTVLSWKLSVATASSLGVLLKRSDYKSSIVHSENSKTFEFAKSRTNFLTEESVDV